MLDKTYLIARVSYTLGVDHLSYGTDLEMWPSKDIPFESDRGAFLSLIAGVDEHLISYPTTVGDVHFNWPNLSRRHQLNLTVERRATDDDEVLSRWNIRIDTTGRINFKHNATVYNRHKTVNYRFTPKDLEHYKTRNTLSEFEVEHR